MSFRVEPEIAWYCLRAQPKHEHIAAVHLRRVLQLDVFSPRLRFRRATKQGQRWVSEALFPGYIFAAFHLENQRNMVCYCQGISGIVHFQNEYPTVPEAVVMDLRRQSSEAEEIVVADQVHSGDTVKVIQGPFSGWDAVVQSVVPVRERISVLLDFLGRQTLVELSVNEVLAVRAHPLALG